MVHRGGHTEFGAVAGDEAIKGVDLGALAALDILRGRGSSLAHVLRQLQPRRYQIAWRQLDSSGARHRNRFVGGGGHDLPGGFILRGTTVARSPKRGDSVARAVDDQLGPEITLDVLGDAG